MKRWVLCLSACWIFSLAFAAAQTFSPPAWPNPGAGPARLNSLSGTVHTQDNRPVRNARVVVRSFMTGETLATGYTLPNGTFEFDNIPRGSYEVVANSGVQEARERVDVFETPTSVNLLLPSETADGAGGSGATVSVAQLKVPHKARELLRKADKAFQQQKLDKAREQVEKALQVFPRYAQALTLRGLLNLHDQKTDAALADLESAVKDDPNYATGYIVLGTAYNLVRRFDDSVRVLERGISLQPDSWQGHFELSKALLAKGQYEPALRQVDKAVQFCQRPYPPLHLVRAHALLGVKNYNLAVAELEQFLSKDPNGADSAMARQTLQQVRAFAGKGE